MNPSELVMLYKLFSNPVVMIAFAVLYAQFNTTMWKKINKSKYETM